MRRRSFLAANLVACVAARSVLAEEPAGLDAAAGALQAAADAGVVRSATLCVRRNGEQFAKAFGAAANIDALFLLGSITKPLCMTAVMTLCDSGRLRLDDRVVELLPEFAGGGREQATLRHLLTHTAGLPDQLPENDELRRSHAGLERFVAAALRTPLLFAPGERYSYSSMGILLAAEIAQRRSGRSIQELTAAAVFEPLGMSRSALGLGSFTLERLEPCQTERAAPESGGGDPTARDWDWNSRYWRELGAPWGGAHCSAPDLATWLGDFLKTTPAVLRPETAALMRRNQNPPGFAPRGLGFALGAGCGSPGLAADVFGHTGSTGTLAWADPRTGTICVVLTSLPGRAVSSHPRQQASDCVARSLTSG